MTLYDAALYYEYAADRPTVRAMVAAYLGVKPKGERQDLAGLASLFGAG